MSAGASDSVWLLLKTGTARLLKQIDPSGKTLREIELPPDLQTVTRLGASRSDDALLLISDDGNTQRVIGVRFQAANQGKSIWEKWFERTLTAFKYFDLKDGQGHPSRRQNRFSSGLCEAGEQSDGKHAASHCFKYRLWQMKRARGS